MYGWSASAVSLVALTAVLAASVARGADVPKTAVENKVSGRLQPFCCGEVTLLEGPLHDAFETNARYVRSLSPDRYLWTFRKTAGLPTPGEPYGGWEAPGCELRGHSMGHYLSACARIIAQTNDAELRKNADYSVAELAKCQARHGNGYLSAFPEEFFDRVERGQKVWAPYYTIHKIMVGLWEMHALAGNAQALEVLKGMADYFKARCDKLDDEAMQKTLRNEFGGMHEVLLNLYASTGQKKYLDLAQRFVKRSFVDPLAEGKDCLPGLHANTHIPQVAGQARAYELTGDERCRRIVEFFYDTLVSAHTYATGGSNVGEHWGPPNRLAGTLSATNQEFCTSYNFEKVCRYLLRWTGDPRYADMIERNFYNGILVSQHPQTGMYIYFLPLGTGHKKSYGTPTDTFTCCYGTAIQKYAALAQDVFYHSGDSLFVSMYTPAAVRWNSPQGRVEVVQRTEYPASPTTRLRLTMDRPTQFKLVLRIPAWATNGAKVTLNGQATLGTDRTPPGSWLSLERMWRDGDTVELAIPMSLRVEPMNDDPALGAVMYGPVVLAGLVDGRRTHMGMPAPVFTGDMRSPGTWIRPVDGRPLTFRTAGQPMDVEFIPIYKVVSQSYGVYWRFAGPGSAGLAAFEEALVKFRAREARIIDAVAIGDPESEKAHDLQGHNTQSGDHHAGRWRHAGQGGFFSYRLKVDPKEANVLVVTYWGSDTGARTFDIMVEGRTIATQTLDRNAPDRLFDVEYAVPTELTNGKTAVVVRFQPSGDGKTAGGIFGLSMLRDEGRTPAASAPGPAPAHEPRPAPQAAARPQAAGLKDYPIRAVPFTDVRVSDAFWSPRLETNRTVTIPYAFKMCEETGRIDNFAVAGRLKEGKFRGIYFNDSDVYKIIEGAAFALHLQADARLDAYLDDVIAKIAAAQEPDGYLYTARTLCGPDYMPPGGRERWSDMGGGHELYCVGHLYEAAVAHHLATGKRTLLDVALKNADLVCNVFGPGRKMVPCGHQEIEIGLVKLYRVTGDEKYLKQAKFFLDIRGRATGGRRLFGIYCQDHKPIVEQTQAVGHAVRAAYMYAAMTDIAAMFGDADYRRAVETLWQDVVGRKLYLTGGIGARGAGEAFGDDYELPNRTAYAETCASIANALWNHRMFLLTGDARFIDLLERVIYNGFLAGVAIEGNRFFYSNPLESHGTAQRSPWFDCACCPSNVVRFVPTIPGYAYAARGSDIYVNLFMGGAATVRLDGQTVRVTQETRYPWEGRVRITVSPEVSGERLGLLVRIPGWAQGRPVPGDLYRYAGTAGVGPSLRVNGQDQPLRTEKGYARIERPWNKGDTVELDLPMDVRRTVAHERVVDDAGRTAIERGPIVFCVEGPDQPDGRVLCLVLADDADLRAEFRRDLLGGVMTVRAKARVVGRRADESPELQGEQQMLAIPYYAWAHRRPGQMAVWLASEISAARPLPAPTLAYRSRTTVSGGGPVSALTDQLLPRNSTDHSNPFFHWWPRKGSLEWVQYDFPRPERVTGVEVYWFDDTGIGECRLPKSWRVLAKVKGEWREVSNPSGYGVDKDRFNRTTFDPVEAEGLRLEVQLPEKFSAGIHEWRVLTAETDGSRGGG